MYILVGIALLRFRLFDIKPIVRDKVIESLDKGILVVDPKNRILDINPFISGLLGLRRSKLIGKRLEDFFPQHGEFESLKGSPLNQKFEIDYVNGNLQQKRLLINITPVFDKDNILTGSILLLMTLPKKGKTQKGFKNRQKS